MGKYLEGNYEGSILFPPPYLPGETEGKNYNCYYLGIKACRRRIGKENLSLCKPERCT